MTTEETVQKLEEWKKIIETARSSGKSVEEWCDENNIRTRNFYYWSKKLKDMEDSSKFYEVPDEEESAEVKGNRDLILKFREFSLIMPDRVDTAALEKVITVLSHA